MATDSQSVSLVVEPHLSLMTRHLLLFDSYGLVLVRRPLWREDESVFCISCWPLPVQSFSGPSPLRLATIFYCLRFETSFFVASYDSQGHGEGIWFRIHTGFFYCSLYYKWFSVCSLGTDRVENTTFNSFLLWRHMYVAAGTFIGRSLGKAVSSGTTIPSFSCHITICISWPDLDCLSIIPRTQLPVSWWMLYNIEHHAEFKHLHSRSALEGQTWGGYGSFCLHSVYNMKHCQQYFTPENFREISWSWLRACVELVHFREVYTEEGFCNTWGTRCTHHFQCSGHFNSLHKRWCNVYIHFLHSILLPVQ
jgi:hypothetical protein